MKVQPSNLRRLFFDTLGGVSVFQINLWLPSTCVWVLKDTT